KTTLSAAGQHLPAGAIPRGEAVGDLSRSVGRSVVDHEDAKPVDRQQLLDERRKIGPLVVRRDDDERPHANYVRGFSKRREAICSDTRPTRNTITANRIRMTAPFGILRVATRLPMP